MGVEKIINSEGNGADFPKKGDYVTMDYTGWLFDESAPGNKGGTPYGTPFDSSVGRDEFKTKIGLGKVIRGWDEGIIGTPSQPGMSLGEKATLVISSDFGYGDRGFPGFIPPSSKLIFDLHLKAINDKRV